MGRSSSGPPTSVTVSILDAAIAATIDHETIGPKVKGNWIESSMLYDAIVAREVISDQLNFTLSTFNRMFARSILYKNAEGFDGSNCVAFSR